MPGIIIYKYPHSLRKEIDKSSPPVFSGVRVTRSYVLYVCLVDRYHFVLVLLSIVLFVLLRYTDSDYPVGIFKLFLIQANSTCVGIYSYLLYYK
jgi:hypothetical protein